MTTRKRKGDGATTKRQRGGGRDKKSPRDVNGVFGPWVRSFFLSLLLKLNCIWDSDDKTTKNDGDRGLAHVVHSIMFY